MSYSSPTQALERLIDGNNRFTSGTRKGSSISNDRLRELAIKGQTPFSIVFTCSDSRVPAEILFDCELGDLFVVRVAGSVISPSIIASIEYAAKNLGTSLCVIMGHTDCGAIKATIQYEQNKSMNLTPHLRHLVKKLRPSVVSSVKRNRILSEEEMIRKSSLEHTRRAAKVIAQESTTIMKLVRNDQFHIMGALCDVSSGSVSFDLPNHRKSSTYDTKPLLHALEQRA